MHLARSIVNPARLIARLTAKTSAAHSIAASGGLPAVSNEEIMAALASVRSRFAQFTADAAALVEVRGGLHRWARCRARRERWPRLPRGGLVRLCDLSLHEHLTPNLCRHCSGRGELLIDERLVDCGQCDGAGTKLECETCRCQKVGVPYHGWLRQWRGRQAAIASHLQAETGAALATIVRELELRRVA